MQPAFACQRYLATLRKTASGKRWKSAPTKQDGVRPLPTQLSIVQHRKQRTTEFSTSQHQKEAKARHVPSEPSLRHVLKPDNLFHSFSNSPAPEIRRRAALIKSHAYCPHPSHHETRPSPKPSTHPVTDSTTETKIPAAHVRFECPDCGIPVYCSEEHWAEDYENHMEICDILRQTNEDDHDLHSGREFPEFEYPGPSIEEAVVNMTNWDTYLYTKEYEAINEEQSMRQATRLLTYPMTIASVIHELSPYNIRKGGRLTPEGLKSLGALRFSLHPPKMGESRDLAHLLPVPPPVRIFVLGARAESSLPRNVWAQLSYLFLRVGFNLIFIGPESMQNRDHELPLPKRTARNPFGAVIESGITPYMKISTYVDYYHTLHRAGYFHPYDPYFDCFFLFQPGLGHPATSHEWEETVQQLLQTKVPVFCTGYSEWDMERDRKWVEEKFGKEVDIMMEPGENRFRSLRWDLNDRDPSEVSCGNWGLWGFRGKRYETTMKDN